jgi:hypothetical protein
VHFLCAVYICWEADRFCYRHCAWEGWSLLPLPVYLFCSSSSTCMCPFYGGGRVGWEVSSLSPRLLGSGGGGRLGEHSATFLQAL